MKMQVMKAWALGARVCMDSLDASLVLALLDHNNLGTTLLKH